MVHALQQTHRLLKPGGILIDIHPLDEPMLFQVHSGGAILFAEPEPDFSGEDYRHAQRALVQVVERGAFVLAGTSQFDFRVYASSIAELRAYLAEAGAYEPKNPDQAAKEREEALAAALGRTMQAAGPGAQVATFERARASKLTAIK